MKRQFRLTSSTDFERVRQTGRSFPHPLVILVAAENEDLQIRVGVAAGKGIGGAVVRNRAKRLLRACVHPLLPGMLPGWDLIFLARKGLPKAGFWKTHTAVLHVLRKAGLLDPDWEWNERRISE